MACVNKAGDDERLIKGLSEQLLLSSAVSLTNDLLDEKFATASYDKTGIVWDAVNLKKEIVLRGHSDGVVIVAFSPDGKLK